ncbi:MAG: hypothetical protein O7F10_02655, partial [Deltaproteobacteria bacterium]|nr:hypothetical protein [Deltaproteobacteria bacterium]
AIFLALQLNSVSILVRVLLTGNTFDNDIDLAHSACLHHTCLPFSDQTLWGRIANWDTDRRLRTDVAVRAARQKVMDSYADERAGANEVDERLGPGSSSQRLVYL